MNAGSTGREQLAPARLRAGQAQSITTSSAAGKPDQNWQSMVGADPSALPLSPGMLSGESFAYQAAPTPPETAAAAAPSFIRRALRDDKILTRVGTALVGGAMLTLVISGLWPQSNSSTTPKASAGTTPPALTLAHGVVGSEKLGFFSDPAVVSEFAHDGFSVRVDPAGSREIASTLDLTHDDFAFPSSLQAAQTIQQAHAVSADYTPFSSPMAIATFEPIADLLTSAGIVHRVDGVLTFDMAQYLKLVAAGARWDQLPGNTAYPVQKSVVITTSDPRSSNSADMYLAVAAYVANNDSIVVDTQAENAVLPTLSRLFLQQGYTGSTSRTPFENYLTEGMGATPMVWIYEAQFIEASVANRIEPGMVLMYPSPTVISTQTLVPLNAVGDRIGQLLFTDPKLQRLATRHGFRTSDPTPFTDVVSEHNVAAPPVVTDVVGTPTYDILQSLLNTIAQTYH